MISSTFLPPSLHLTEKTEIFPEFLHIQFLSPFPFPEATLPRPVCLLAGPPVAPLVKCTPCQGQIKKKGFVLSNQ